MLSALAFLLVAGAVFFLSLVSMGILTRAIERYRERYVTQSMSELAGMFLFIDPSQIIVLNVLLMLLLASMGFILGGVLAMLVLGALGFFLPSGIIRFMRKRRVDRFEAQLVDALQQFSGSLRAGLTLPQSIEQISKESQPPLQQEFGLYVREIKLGVNQDEALLNMARRVGSEDLELVATSTQVARSMGGNLAEMFETISGTIRERFRLQRKILSITAQGRMQGWIVSAMPFLLGLVMYFLYPDLMGPLFNGQMGWVGYALFAVILVWEAIGIVVIMKIVNVDV